MKKKKTEGGPHNSHTAPTDEVKEGDHMRKHRTIKKVLRRQYWQPLEDRVARVGRKGSQKKKEEK